MSSSAFRIGTLLTFVALTNHIVPSLADDEAILVSRAINFWATKMFVSYFTEFTLPPATNVASGMKFYCSNEELNFEEKGKSGVIADMSLDKLTDVVNVWKTSNLISPQASASIGNVFEKDGFKTILETVHIQDDGQLVYGTLGFVELTKVGNSREATVLYAFKKFKLQTPTAVSFDTDANECILWGAFCATSFRVDGYGDSESRNLFSYIRFETINSFVKESGPYLEYLDKESIRCKYFLPQTIALAVTKIEQNPDKVLTELFTEDPFVVNV